MAKLVKVHTIPWCDFCNGVREGGRGILAKYNAPLNRHARSVFYESWASLCGKCFDMYGLDTSVTEEYIRDPEISSS